MLRLKPLLAGGAILLSLAAPAFSDSPPSPLFTFGSLGAGPGQFDHPLLRRAKCEVSAAALAHAVVPAHGVTLVLDDPELVYADAKRARDEFGFLRFALRLPHGQPLDKLGHLTADRAGSFLSRAGWGAGQSRI